MRFCLDSICILFLIRLVAKQLQLGSTQPVAPPRDSPVAKKFRPSTQQRTTAATVPSSTLPGVDVVLDESVESVKRKLF